MDIYSVNVIHTINFEKMVLPSRIALFFSSSIFFFSKKKNKAQPTT